MSKEVPYAEEGVFTGDISWWHILAHNRDDDDQKPCDREYTPEYYNHPELLESKDYIRTVRILLEEFHHTASDINFITEGSQLPPFEEYLNCLEEQFQRDFEQALDGDAKRKRALALKLIESVRADYRSTPDIYADRVN